MHPTTSHARLFAAVLAAVIVTLTSAAAADKSDAEGFQPLFNGKDFTGWKFILTNKDADPTKTWSVKEGVVICTGRPNGYFYTDKSYKNYILRYDWRYARPSGLQDDSKFGGNSGALVHIHEPHKVWPQCVEVQGMNRDHGLLLGVSGVKLTGAKFDRDAKNKATKPVGEWNTTEIICKADGSIEAKINGTPVSSGKSPLTDGPIGFQSEGAEIHFRNIMLKDLK
jgi:hypothetical protein